MDLFGKALRTFHRDQSDADITLIRDDGWEDSHSPSLYFKTDPFDFEEPALAQIDGPTLDIGCGAGRHVKWLADHGHAACGLDVSQGAVDVCHAQGIASVQRFDIMGDARPTLPFTPQNICLFGNNIGIGGSLEGSTQLLKNLHALCAKDGRLLLTGIDVRRTENPRHIAYHTQNIAKGRRRGEMTLKMRYNTETGPDFAWYHPEPHEIEELSAASGWKIETLESCGGFFWAALRAR